MTPGDGDDMLGRGVLHVIRVTEVLMFPEIQQRVQGVLLVLVCFIRRGLEIFPVFKIYVKLLTQMGISVFLGKARSSKAMYSSFF